MTPSLLYFVFFALLIIGAVEISLRDQAISRYLGFFALALLLFFSSMRSPGFGSDDLAYLDILERVSQAYSCTQWLCGYSYAEFNVEIGFFALLVVIAVLGGSAVLLFGVVSAVSLGFSVKAIKSFFPYVLPPLLVYFAHHFLAKELNALRLAVAGALVFFAGACCVGGRYRKAFFFVLVASFFHVSALIALVPVVLCDWSRRRSRELLLFCGVLVVAKVLFSSSEVYKLLSLVSFVENKVNLYMNADQYNYEIPLFDPVNVKNIVLLSFSLVVHKKIAESFDGFHVALVFFGFAVLIRFLFSDFAIFAGRGFGVVSVFECVLASMLAFHYFGRNFGYLALSLYAFLMLTLNLFVSNLWLGDVGYFGV